MDPQRRVEELVEELGPPGEELAAALMELYGEGLRRIFAAVDEEGTDALRRRLVDDGVVASLMLMHGLYPVALEARVLEGLEMVRPYMESHGGDVRLLGVEDGVARIRLEGSCQGCTASSATLAERVEQALEVTAPDLQGLEVEGVDAAPAHPPPLGVFELPMAAAPPPDRHAAGGCELCSIGMSEEHRHLIHLGERRILCVCASCWALRSGDGDYRPVGNRTVRLEEFSLTGEQWAAFGIPIGLAFFMISSVSGSVIALYPSPAGATESELDLEAWADVVAANPGFELEPDTEALIVNRLSEPAQALIAPIDAAYGLVGVVKSSWEGISGGAGVTDAVSGYLAGVGA
jgi:Fe-S cluster biogenesis protein NfuA